jgi:uncharacterized membrane protein YbaN (DUF454 family)
MSLREKRAVARVQVFCMVAFVVASIGITVWAVANTGWSGLIVPLIATVFWFATIRHNWVGVVYLRSLREQEREAARP